jgi:hypothetical protein
VLWVYNLISFLYVCTVSNMQHINDWMSKPMICFGGSLLSTIGYASFLCLLLLGGDVVEF